MTHPNEDGLGRKTRTISEKEPENQVSHQEAEVLESRVKVGWAPAGRTNSDFGETRMEDRKDSDNWLPVSLI